jgi:cytochrome c peroxidase
MEDLKFVGRQMKWAPRHGARHRSQVEDEVAHAKCATRRGELPPRAPDNCADPCVEFSNRKWLGDVVVRAKFESGDTIELGCASGRHDDGHTLPLPDVPTHGVSVDGREQDVEHDDIKVMFVGFGYRRRTIRTDHDRHALLPKKFSSESSQAVVVLHQEHSYFALQAALRHLGRLAIGEGPRQPSDTIRHKPNEEGTQPRVRFGSHLDEESINVTNPDNIRWKAGAPLGLAIFGFIACSEGKSPDVDASGGANATGGSTSTGGANASGGVAATCQTPKGEDLFPHFDFSGESPRPEGGAPGGPGGPAAAPGTAGGAPGGPPGGSAGSPGGSGPPGGVTSDECIFLGTTVLPPNLHNVANRTGTAADVLVPDPTCGFLALDDFATSRLLGENGRHCMTCHSDDGEWTSTPEQFRDRFNKGLNYLVAGNRGEPLPPTFPTNAEATDNDALEPAFRTVDGANSPLADVSTPEAREAAYSLLLSRGVFRIGLPMPENSEFELVEVVDPYDFASAEELSLFRRSPPMANLRFHTTLMFDGRDTLECKTLTESLKNQAAQAVIRHAEGETPSDDVVQLIVNGELTIYTAQLVDNLAGTLADDGAQGGPWSLAQQPFYWGINAFEQIDPEGVLYSREVFQLYESWRELSETTERDVARSRIAKGEQIFNSREFEVRGVSGFNDVLGRESIVSTCGACHNTPNVGTNSEGRLMNVGTSDEDVSAELPLYTFRNSSSGELLKTSDPGRALVTGRWSDMNRMKVPSLRALAGRAPYFHNGIAPTLEAAIDHHDQRFNIGFSRDEVAALVAFLNAL